MDYPLQTDEAASDGPTRPDKSVRSAEGLVMADPSERLHTGRGQDSLRAQEQLPRPFPRVRLGGVDLDHISEAEVVDQVISGSQAGCGGWIATPNIDICRKAERDPDANEILMKASLRVADGMPLVWASRLIGQSLPERVSGSSLIFSLSAAAAASGRSVYLLGGAARIPDLAAARLSLRYVGLKVVGTDSPSFGFENDVTEMAAVRDKLLSAAPDIVYVGLGFPKQEDVIIRLISALPRTWFIACGAAIPFAAGVLPRAPIWMRRSGLEWVFRLLSEPRRLARRYVIDDAPYAMRLLVSCMIARLKSEWAVRR